MNDFPKLYLSDAIKKFRPDYISPLDKGEKSQPASNASGCCDRGVANNKSI